MGSLGGGLISSLPWEARTTRGLSKGHEGEVTPSMLPLLPTGYLHPVRRSCPGAPQVFQLRRCQQKENFA